MSRTATVLLLLLPPPPLPRGAVVGTPPGWDHSFKTQAQSKAAASEARRRPGCVLAEAGLAYAEEEGDGDGGAAGTVGSFGLAIQVETRPPHQRRGPRTGGARKRRKGGQGDPGRRGRRAAAGENGGEGGPGLREQEGGGGEQVALEIDAGDAGDAGADGDSDARLIAHVVILPHECASTLPEVREGGERGARESVSE